MSKRRIVILICVAIVLLSLLLLNQVLFAETNLTNGLVAYYPFNGNASDESGNGNHGIIYEAALTTDRFGNPNCAYTFDGINDYIDCDNHSSLSISDNISIQAWVMPKYNAYGDRGIVGNLYYDSTNTYKGGYALQEWTIGKSADHFWYGRISNSTGGNLNAGDINKVIVLNSWQHLLMTYNNYTLKIYINGVLINSVTGSASLKPAINNNHLFIGKHSYSNLFFNGIIDDVRIYNRALSDSEIQTLYHEGGWQTPNLIQNSNFDNGVVNWYYVTNGTNVHAEKNWDTADYATAPGSLKVKCYNNGDSYKDIQLLTNRFDLVKDRTYLLTFKAKCSAGFTIPYIKLNQAVSPWNDYALPYAGLAIATSGATNWQDYAAIFTANANVSDARVTFFLGGALPDGATFNLDDVSLKEFVVYSPPVDELLPNPGFDQGAGNWYFSTDASAQASGSLDAENYDCAPVSYRIQCLYNGDTQNSIQLFTMPLSIVQNKTYQLTFRAKSNSIFAIPSIRLMKAASPWTSYANPYSGLTITNDWQSYTITFTANSTASDGRITFFLGNALPDGAVFWIDSLSLREIVQ